MALYSLLAKQDITQLLPMGVAAVCGVILVIAFLVGYVRGFRKINWSSLLCLVVLIAFAAVHAMMTKSNKRIALRFGDLDPTTLSNIIIAIGCVLGALFVYGLCTICFRPIRKGEKRAKRKSSKLKIKYGIDLDNEEDEYIEERERELAKQPRKRVWYNVGKPTVVGRCIGSVVCVLNTAVVLMIVIAATLLLMDGLGLRNTNIGKVFNIKVVDKAYKIATTYAFDFMSLGIIILVAFKGFKNGLVGSIRSIIVTFGGIAVAVLAFYLPFSPFVDKIPFLKSFLERCSNTVKGLNDMLEPVAGKLLMGVCLFAVLALVLGLVNFILTKSSRAIRGAAPVRIVDGCIACVLYVIVGVALMIAVWCVLSALQYCGLFDVSKIIGKEAPLANGLLDMGGDLLRMLFDKMPYGDNIKQLIEKVLAK